MKARLILEDGKCFEGNSFGATGTFIGKVVLNNSMIGYQQVITDPANGGLLVCMTYPLIGNYGINRGDIESSRFFLKGLIVRESCRYPSNFRNEENLDSYLISKGAAGMEGVDTRHLSRYLQDKGSIRGALTTADDDIEQVIKAIKKEPETNCPEKTFKEKISLNEEIPQVAVIDLGVRLSFIRALQKSGISAVVLPGKVDPQKIKELNPRALIVVGGAYVPDNVTREIVSNMEELIGQFPLLGISLGMQIIAMAAGASLKSLTQGHRGEGYPVKDVFSGRVYNTSQNRGVTIDEETLPPGVVVTHYNMHDNSIEGIKDEKNLFWGFEFWPYYSNTEQELTPDLPEAFMNYCRGGI